MTKNKIYLTGFLTLLWITAVILMIQNYNNYPPLPESNPLHERINNLYGSIWIYPPLSFAELLAGIIWIRYYEKIPLYIHLLLILLSFGLVVWSWFNAIHAGGVEAGQCLWVTAEFTLIYGCFLFRWILSFTSIKS